MKHYAPNIMLFPIGVYFKKGVGWGTCISNLTAVNKNCNTNEGLDSNVLNLFLICSYR